MDIEAITRPEDKDYSFSRYAHSSTREDLNPLTFYREGWQVDEASRQRGFAWQDRLYKHNQATLDHSLAAQKDFGEWMIEITCIYTDNR